MVFGVFAGLFGVWYSTVIRLEFQAPGHQILGGASHYYYTLITMHGLVMIFFSVMPILIGGLGNFIVPSQLATGKLPVLKIMSLVYPGLLFCLPVLTVSTINTRTLLIQIIIGVLLLPLKHQLKETKFAALVSYSTLIVKR